MNKIKFLLTSLTEETKETIITEEDIIEELKEPEAIFEVDLDLHEESKNRYRDMLAKIKSQPKPQVESNKRPYSQLIDVLKEKGADNFFCNSINYMMNTFFNDGNFTSKQSELTLPQVQQKEKFILDNLGVIMAFEEPRQVLDYVHLILFNHKDATEKQQIQLNYSKAYMIKNGQPN